MDIKYYVVYSVVIVGKYNVCYESRLEARHSWSVTCRRR